MLSSKRNTMKDEKGKEITKQTLYDWSQWRFLWQGDLWIAQCEEYEQKPLPGWENSKSKSLGIFEGRVRKGPACYNFEFLLCDFTPKEVFFWHKVKVGTGDLNKLSPKRQSKTEDGPEESLPAGFGRGDHRRWEGSGRQDSVRRMLSWVKVVERLPPNLRGSGKGRLGNGFLHLTGEVPPTCQGRALPPEELRGGSWNSILGCLEPCFTFSLPKADLIPAPLSSTLAANSPSSFQS